MEKECPQCRRVLPLGGFNRRGSGYAYECRECANETSRQWAKKNPELKALIARRNRSPEKTFAHNAVFYAVQAGHLVRPEACDECGKDGIIEAHHTDYGRPLEVEWLCKVCHRARHIAARTHCRHGHLLANNPDKDGRCAECRRIRQRDRWKKKAQRKETADA